MQNEKKQQKIFTIGFWLIVAVILIFVIKPFVLKWKNGQSNLDEQKANEEILKAPSATADELLQKIQNKSKIYLVDISLPDDFGRGHIASSANASADKLNKDFFKSIGADSAADIFIISQGGDLAALAATTNKIVSAGFVNAKYLRGGIADWREQSYPLVSFGASDADSAKVKKITIDEIKKEAASNPGILKFLDVRDKDSFEKEHIVGAINIPLSQLEARKNEVPSVEKVIVYGSGDSDSFQAAAALFDLNFWNIYQMQGTLDNWRAAGGITE